MRISIIFFFICFLFCNNLYASDFLNGFEDIPLMPGFNQLSTQDFSFSNEETGYTETIITSPKNINFIDIKTFYYNSLSALGWKIKEDNFPKLIFIRENDILEITQIKKHPLKLLVSLKSEN